MSTDILDYSTTITEFDQMKIDVTFINKDSNMDEGNDTDEELNDVQMSTQPSSNGSTKTMP